MSSRLSISQINHICDIFGFDTKDAFVSYATSDKIRHTIQINHKSDTLIVDEYYTIDFKDPTYPIVPRHFVVSFRNSEVFGSQLFNSFNDIYNFLEDTEHIN